MVRPMGTILSVTAAPVTASPSAVQPEPSFAQGLILPVSLSLIRPVLTLRNPGTNDPALPLPTSPSMPSSDVPKGNHKEKQGGGTGYGG